MMAHSRRATTLALLGVLALPPVSSWLGADKVKHFLMSALVQSASFSAARAARMSRPNAQAIGGVTTMSVGLWKELRDRKIGRSFSVPDLVWDAAGGVAAAGLMNGTR